jgi:hypothetical protein
MAAGSVQRERGVVRNLHYSAALNKKRVHMSINAKGRKAAVSPDYGNPGISCLSRFAEFSDTINAGVGFQRFTTVDLFD